MFTLFTIVTTTGQLYLACECPALGSSPARASSPSGLAAHQEGSSYFVIGRRASSLKALHFLWPESVGFVFFCFLFKGWRLNF